MKKVIRYFIFSLVILAISCDSSTKPAARQPAIYGKAVDEQGSPVANADVILLLQLPIRIGVKDWLPVVKKGSNNKIMSGEEESDSIRLRIYPNPVTRMTSIEFTVFERSEVSIQITEFATKKTLNVFESSILEAGQHQISYDFGYGEIGDSLKSDGLYTFELSISDSVFYKDIMLVNRWNPEQYKMMKGVAKTNSKGEFRIDYDMIPFGREMTKTALNGQILGKYIIGDSIAIIAKKQVSADKYLIFKQKLQADTTKVVDLPCVLVKQ